MGDILNVNPIFIYAAASSTTSFSVFSSTLSAYPPTSSDASLYSETSTSSAVAVTMASGIDATLSEVAR